MKKKILNWLGITNINQKIHNLEGDVMCIMEKQQHSPDLEPIAEDNPINLKESKK